MKNSTLLMAGIVAAVAMLSAGLSIIPVQQASANDGRGDGDGANTDLGFEQDQKNKCSGSAICTNDARIMLG
jgi:hypothetical protein